MPLAEDLIPSPVDPELSWLHVLPVPAPAPVAESLPYLQEPTASGMWVAPDSERRAAARAIAARRSMYRPPLPPSAAQRVRDAADRIVDHVEQNGGAETEGRARNAVPKRLRPVAARGIELAAARAASRTPRAHSQGEAS